MNDQERILNMLAEGKISVEEAETLISALKDADSKTPPSNSLIKVMNQSERSAPFYGKVIVEIKSGKGENVKIKLPLKLANLALKMIPKDKLSELGKEGINLKEIIENLSNFVDEIDDDILNITSAGGDSVRVYIER